MELVDKLKSDPSLGNQPDAVTGLDEMGVLLKYCSVLGIADMVCIATCSYCMYIRVSYSLQFSYITYITTD